MMQNASATAPDRIRLCFGRVRHARLRPVGNAFDYRVYFIRVPLRASAGPTGCKLFSRNRFNLLSFHDADHGDGHTPPLQWIETVLQREGIADADGEIWLQTFPRVLGYVFNPVSFWFCHRADGRLRAILCEVNNTFGERHCYLLETGAAMPYGVELGARKVFHVSPFCETRGSYRFRFMQSVRQAGESIVERHCARIDYEDADGPLLQTSVSGQALPLTDAVAAKAFLSYPLMTLAVIARIHWQALRLWRMRVPFFRKPLPPTSEMSR